MARLPSGSCQNDTKVMGGRHAWPVARKVMSSTSTSDMMPSQKDGVAIPAIAITRTKWSSQVFSFRAEIVPSGMAIRMAITVARTATSSDNRQADGDLVDDRIARPHRYAEVEGGVAPQEMQELHDHRVVEAKLLAARRQRRRIDMGAAGAEPDHADVARDQAHQHEDQRRRSCQRRDRQQEPRYDVAIHWPRSTSSRATCPARRWRGPGSSSGSG